MAPSPATRGQDDEARGEQEGTCRLGYQRDPSRRRPTERGVDRRAVRQHPGERSRERDDVSQRKIEAAPRNLDRRQIECREWTADLTPADESRSAAPDVD